jgi:beta-glucanase (GH16 family)
MTNLPSRSAGTSQLRLRAFSRPDAASGRGARQVARRNPKAPADTYAPARPHAFTKIAPVAKADNREMALVPTFADEFEGPAGTPPDPKRWTYDIGGDGWGNGQLEYNTNRVENVALDGKGCLAITARREKHAGNDYTSARIKTEGLFATRFGRVEASIKLPPGQGIWPAFWMLGTNAAEAGWPGCGEIDIMEYRGQFPRDALATIHGPGYSGAGGIGKTLTLGEGGFDKDFHVFTADWEPGKIVFSIDGIPYQTITREAVTPLGPWVFDDHPFFLILNVAVGGGFVGSPDATTPFPATMLVDYVRVFEKRPKP